MNGMDAGLRREIQLLWEQIYELKSQHGVALPRAGIKTSGPSSSMEGDGTNPLLLDQLNKGVKFGNKYYGTTFAPVKNLMYMDCVPKALAFSDGNGTLYTAFNISDLTRIGVGDYTYTFHTP